MGLLDGFKKINTAVDRKIKKIQRSRNETKKKWVIGGSIVAIVLIISLWVMYINITLPTVAPPQAEQEQVQQEESVSFFEAVSEGATVLYTNIETSVSYSVDKIRTIFEKRREFEISN